MPPNRTVPPAKIVKTERTHEENQERAYIAASRRSDRSLEARVESARRASEIHKRRTGRSLRVTEQDVINEEMYEEEDDDLPMQYRRLTAHLQTGSADFNRRLAAYLTNQVAMRNAVGQLATNHYSHHFGGGGMAYNQPRQNMFQSPAPQQQQHQQQPNHQQQHQQQHQMQQQPMPHNQLPQHTSGVAGFRQSPYPSPHHPGYRNSHGRSYSTAVIPTVKAQTPPTPVSASLDHRRMSTPATVHPHIDTTGLKSDPEYVRQTQSAQIPPPHFNPYWQDMSPFTTSLPPESQQMLAGSGALDPNDPFSAALMHGSEHYTSHPYYPWSAGSEMNHAIKGMPVHPSAYAGMSATLAPAALTTPAESLSATPNTNTTGPGDYGHSSASMDPLGLNHLFVPGKDGNSPHSIHSGQMTPGESFWSNFVQDGGWNDESATMS